MRLVQTIVMSLPDCYSNILVIRSIRLRSVHGTIVTNTFFFIKTSLSLFKQLFDVTASSNVGSFVHHSMFRVKVQVHSFYYHIVECFSEDN